MGNIFAAARERNCTAVTLTAASRPLAEVFARYGFAVEPTSLARGAMELGPGIPMQATV
jgi:hypothetical protein